MKAQWGSRLGGPTEGTVTLPACARLNYLYFGIPIKKLPVKLQTSKDFKLVGTPERLPRGGLKKPRPATSAKWGVHIFAYSAYDFHAHISCIFFYQFCIFLAYK